MWVQLTQWTIFLAAISSMLKHVVLNSIYKWIQNEKTNYNFNEFLYSSGWTKFLTNNVIIM